MKLRNKKTGEIGELQITEKHCAVAVGNGTASCGIVIYNSLAELNAEWEDYVEPKDDATRVITSFIHYVEEADDSFCCDKSVKNLVEKLKAWKRLKDKGFRFKGWTIDDGLRISICTNADEDDIYNDDKRRIKPDLDLLFGGEDE